MNTSLKTGFLLGFLVLLAAPAHSMESSLPANSIASLEGLTNPNIASSFPFDISVSQSTQLDSLELRPSTDTSSSETITTPDYALSLTNENVGEPSTSSITLPLFQF